jgi:uncharacterized membrane protein
MYLPLALQRRLSIGLGVPLGLLAGMGWWRGARKHVRIRVRGLIRGLIIAFSALTPIFLIVAAATTALRAEVPNGHSWLYLSDGEWAALEWLHDRLPLQGEAVVLCAPQMGTFVPAWSGHRVVYGHPFETVNADQREEQVEAYWTGEMSESERTAFLQANDVDYILIGPREQAMGADIGERVEAGVLLFEKDDTRVYAVNER